MLPVGANAACELYPRFTPTAGRLSNEAWEADRFVDSIGVNLHLGSGRYETEFYRIIKPRLLEAGIRRVRTNFRGLAYVPHHLRELGQAGIRITLATDGSSRLDKLAAGVKAVGPDYIISVEGLNEPESRHGCRDEQSCWVQPTRDHQRELYSAVRSDPALRHIRVLGPSLKTQNLEFSPRMFGNMDRYMEGFSIHRYPGPEIYPENPLYLSQLGVLQRLVASPAKPAFITETGYSTDNTSESSEAIYMPRLYLRNFNHGVVLSTKYELLDARSGGEHPKGWSPDMNRGYLRYNGTVKPSFTAVKNLIGVLQDRGGRFVPGVLNYSLTGNTANVYRVLTQKRDGTYYLALWVAKPIRDTDPQAITINLPSSVDSAAVVRPNDGQAWRQLGLSGNRVNLYVDEKVSIVRLRGASGQRPSCG